MKQHNSIDFNYDQEIWHNVESVRNELLNFDFNEFIIERVNLNLGDASQDYEEFDLDFE